MKEKMTIRGMIREKVLPMEYIIDVFGGHKFDNCLDVGAGTGLFLSVFYDNGIIKRGVGIEIDDKYFKVINQYLYITSEDKIGNEKFDMIMFNDVLHHVKNKTLLLDKYVKYLKDGGYVFVKEMSDQNIIYKYLNRFHDLIVSGEKIHEISVDHLKSIMGSRYDVIKQGRRKRFLYDHYFILFKQMKI